METIRSKSLPAPLSPARKDRRERGESLRETASRRGGGECLFLPDGLPMARPSYYPMNRRQFQR